MWIAQGKTYRDTGDILGISFAAVKTNLDNARRKLDAINLCHAVALALTHGIIIFDGRRLALPPRA